MIDILEPIVFLRTFYLAASALVLFIQAIPALRARFLSYGPRASTNSASSKPSLSASKSSTSLLLRSLDYLSSFQVPHNYFTYFYATSVLCSLFWCYQIWQLTPPARPGSSDRSISHVNISNDWQITITCMMMTLQGTRRLFESYAYTSSSKSKMWLGHHILGILFYLTINIAIWIEIAPTLASKLPFAHVPMYNSSPVAISAAPQWQWRLFLIPLAILRAQYLQHSYHRYLFDLRSSGTYKLPSHPSFPNLICPHYTCEIAIYLLMSVLAAPVGQIMNWTLVCATIFVVVNLGVTAQGTKEWYVERFGVEKVRGRWKMIPRVW